VKPKIAVTLPREDANFQPDQRRRLAEFAEVLENETGRRLRDEEKIALMRDADGAIVGRGGGGLSREVIERCPRLRVVGVIGGTVKLVEPELLFERGVTLINTAYAMSDAVAEFTLALILNSLRDIPHMIESMQRDGWGRARRMPANLKGRTVALIGFGLIARRLRELLEPFGCRVLVFDPYAAPETAAEHNVVLVPLEKALSEADVISLHAGLTPETEGMIGAKELALVKDGALIVNTARGKLFDEDALARELKTGRIFASLNVFAREPLPMDSPLRGLPNVILTPHGAGHSIDTMRIQSEMIVDDMHRFFSGETPRSLVTREALRRMT